MQICNTITVHRVKALSLLTLFVMAFVIAMPVHMVHEHHCNATDIELHQHDGTHPDFEFTTFGLASPVSIGTAPKVADVNFSSSTLSALCLDKQFLYQYRHHQQLRLRGPPLA